MSRVSFGLVFLTPLLRVGRYKNIRMVMPQQFWVRWETRVKSRNTL